MSDKVTESDAKSEDKKDIELEEKKMNEENKAQDKITTEQPAPEIETGKLKDDIKEGLEVKPKKVPIGGIQMPGFFTRSKSKDERNKESEEHVDAEATELLETKEDKKDDSLLSQARVKLPSLFRRSKAVDEDVEKSTAEPKEPPRPSAGRNFVDNFRKTLVSVLPNRNKDNTNMENKAGLASMETLDDNDKTADKGDDMKNISLDDKKEEEKQEVGEPEWQRFLKQYRKAISAVLLFLLLLIIILCISIPGKKVSYAAPIKDGRYVQAVTKCGMVEGLVEDSAIAFRGIPYARPPIGELRFQPAKPTNSLDYCWNGTLLAHNATDVCIQLLSNGTVFGVEDCLTVDVVTPYVRYDNPLPVVVLVGAETLVGGAPGKLRPSARYARTRDVLFVRPNFRLGALGFLATDALTRTERPPRSGNYALTDIIEALQWVQLNIRNFGGDPRQVTLFGHRAGATIVTALATTPDAHKLFSRAWAASPSALYPSLTLNEASAANAPYLAAVGCEQEDLADVLECLQTVDVERLVEAVPDVWRPPSPEDLPTKTENASARHHWMVIDGAILRENPATVWADDQRNLSVKLVLGTTAHAAASDKLLLRHTNWTEALVTAHVRASLPGNGTLASDALSMYEHTYKGLATMVSDIRTVCPLYAISTQMRGVPLYVVAHPRTNPVDPTITLADVDSDVDAILGRYEPKTPEQRRYVSALQQLFYHYVWHGAIVEAQGAADMLALGGGAQRLMVVDQDLLPARNYSQCDYWIRNDVVLRYAHLD